MNKVMSSQGIGEQNAAYRRGLVLGLTMAEVGILIIFVLLLLLAFGEWFAEKDREKQRGKTTISSARLKILEASNDVMRDLAVTVGAGPNPLPEEIKLLVQGVKKAATSASGQTFLTEARTELKKVADVRERLARVAKAAGRTDGESMARSLEKQGYELLNKEGQLERYEKQLKELGRGSGERPCWVRPDGGIDYLYDVVLTSSGIRMKEYANTHREAERALLPMPEVNPSEVLTPEEFLRRTGPLFYQSVAQNCRFFVVVYDTTAPTEKQLYKRLLQVVEGHFYKRLDNGPAPF